MFRYVIPLLASLFLCAYGGDDNILVGTEENLDEILRQNEITLVEFYAPWCGHCKKLAPEYAKAAEELKEHKSIVLVKVDATAETALAERFKIEGYPTLKMFRNGEPAEYEGGRNAKDMVAFMKRQIGAAVKQLSSSAEFEAFVPQKKKDSPVAIVFGSAGSSVVTFFTGFANKKRNDFTFGAVSDLSITQGEKADTIVLFKPYDEKRIVYSGDLSEGALLKFLKQNSLKMVDEIGADNYRSYVDRGLPIVWLFVDPEKDPQLTHRIMGYYEEIAPEFKNDVSLVYINGPQFKQMAQKLSLSGTQFPALATEDAQGEHYAYSEKEEISVEGMRAWLKKFLAGALVPTIRSEDIPTEPLDDGGVRIVVGNTFQDIVMDKNNDVLIEFYAPWCGHCKKLAPIYSELAGLMKNTKGVVIAKMDATANDPPPDFKVSGFPSIRLVTAGDNKVVEYDGPRTKKSFIEFLKQNANNMQSTGHDPSDL